MTRFVLRRLIQAVPTLFGITLISFLLMLSAPGDPVTLITFTPESTSESADVLRRQLGLDKPAIVQYMYWLIGNDWTMIDVDGDGEPDIPGTRRGFLRGDLGQSLQHKRPVTELIVERIPATLRLTLTAVIFGYIVGITVGVLAARFSRSWFDQLTRFLSVIGNAVPAFWLALLMIIIFSVQLGWLPMGGMRDITNTGPRTFGDSFKYMIMPVFVLSLGIIATVSRYMRAEVMEVLSQDYIRTAYAKGLSQGRIMLRHVMRNAMIPIAALLGPALGSLLGGAVIIEQVFSWPGMGRLVINGVFQRDYPLIMGSVVIGSVLYILGVLLSDILYAWIDPRIRLQ